jgi:serine/threonine protein kinase
METTTSSFARGRYSVERELGRGGMSVVYLAHDRELDRPVAIKVLAPHLTDDPDFVRRFRREARTAAQLAHPNIVQVFDFGEADSLFIVMEYVDGERLDAVRTREGRLPAATVVTLATQACAALGYAHERDVVHRDVKPANLLLRSDGTLKVADFGIARAGDATALTQAGTILGSAAYVAPEQARGEPVGPQADLFSLGVVLYELLAGSTPWQVDRLAQLATIAEAPPPPLRSLAPETPPAVEAAITSCLARDPADRPRSAADLALALSGEARPTAATVALGSEPPTAATRVLRGQPADARPRRQRASGRAPPRADARRLLPLVAAALVAALIGILVVATSDGDEPAPARVEPAPRADDAAEQARQLEDWLRDHTGDASLGG